MRRRLSFLHQRIAAGLIVAVFVNLLVFSACVWSAGGQVTTVEIEMVGDAYVFRIDGRQLRNQDDGQRSPVVLETPRQGSISLTVVKGVPSLPDPQGIESVIVRDLSGRELFREDFQALDEDRWEVTAGSFHIEDGVLVPLSQPGHNTVVLDHQGWGDNVLTVTYRNAMAIAIGARMDERGGIFFYTDLVRDNPVFVEGYALNGSWSGTNFFQRIETSKTQTVRSLSAMVLKSYPFILLGLIAGTLVSAILPLTPGAHRRLHTSPRQWLRRAGPSVRSALPWAPLGAVLAVAAFAFALALYILLEVYTRIAHLPDESSYVFQAKLFASGRITGAIPPVKEVFYAWEPNFLYEHNDRWATLYPFGQPVLLTPGALIDAVWLIPPLAGAGCIVLMFLVGRRMFDARIGVISAVLLAASPFFLMQASNYMSHNTWMFYMLLSLFFLLKRERVLLYGALSGLFFGLALNTRTAESLALVLPFGALLLAYVIFAPRQDRLVNLKYLGGFCLGGGLMLLAMLGYNAATTGDPFLPSYTAWSRETEGAEVVGFTGGHTLEIGLRNIQTQLMALTLVLHAWPVWVGLAFVALPFILGTRNRWDYFLLVCALMVAGVYILYSSSMLHQGPRYWYQTMPFLLLLSARGVVLAGTCLGGAATLLRQRLTGDARSSRWAGMLTVYALVAVLVLNGTGGWIFGWNKQWRDVPQVQHNLEGVRLIYDFDDRLLRLESEMNLQNALILVLPCGHYNVSGWYNTIFDRNSVNFDGNVVWARHIPEHLDDLLAAFPDREVYIADYVESSITPYDPETTYCTWSR